MSRESRVAMPRAVWVDRVRCSGHGACAQIAPDAVELDEWGYPMLTGVPVDRRTGREAVTLCPAQALFLQ